MNICTDIQKGLKMSIRSNWCEFDKETRKYIKKRDRNKCIICGNSGGLQIMHIFLSRAKGGKGCKENGCLGCVKCHKILDNPIGEKQLIKQYEIKKYCMNYLMSIEDITYNDEFIETLKFDKTKLLRSNNIKQIEKQIEVKKYTNKCKNCRNLIKNKNNMNSIPSYYCKYKKQIKNKNSEICENFRRYE